MNNRSEKIREALHKVAAEFLSREAGRQSLITVTNTMVSDDGRRGTVYITVLPESAENAALGFANRSRGELADFFKTRIRGVFPPRIEFVLDRGEKNRQRLDELS